MLVSIQLERQYIIRELGMNEISALVTGRIIVLCFGSDYTTYDDM